MKTATVTWISYNNYGTLLQAYALQQKIKQLGHENEILWDGEILKAYSLQRKNTQPKTKQAAAPRRISPLHRAVRVLTSPAKAQRALLARTNRKQFALPYDGSQRAFDRFREEDLQIFRQVGPERLQALNDRYEAFVAGSDQIWSVFESIFNPYYYLEFASKRKIAYAPCMGTDQIPEGLRPRLQALLSDYHALSAREDVSAKQLTALTGRSVEWVADPTLLLTSEQWSACVKQSAPPVKGRYLLCYFLENRPWYFEQAGFLAKKLHLRPVLIPNKWDYLNSEYVIDGVIGPKEFVSLFQNAAFVLTDSYHGSIFSCIFEKDFQYLQRFEENDPHSQNIRIHSLFSYLGLDGVTATPERHFILPKPIDKDAVQRKITVLRDKSIRYLDNSLQ